MAEIDAIDEIFVTLAPIIFGGATAPTLCGLPGTPFPHPTRARLASMETVGDECFLHYVVRHRVAGD
jgi:riboflavin biosynthesis pyrimidine reductase